MQLQRAVRGAAQLRGDGVAVIILGRIVERALFGEDVAAVKAAHDQIRLAVVLFQVDGGGIAAEQLDHLHLPDAVTAGCDAQGQLHLFLLVRAHVAHREDRIAGGIGGQRLCFSRVLPIGRRDLRAADRVSLCVLDLNLELKFGNDGDAEIRIGGVFFALQLFGFTDQRIERSSQRFFSVLGVQSIAAFVHLLQVRLVIPADALDDLPDLALGLQGTADDLLAFGLASLAALVPLDAVEDRQAVILQLRFKAGEGVLQFEQNPLGFCRLRIQTVVRIQHIITLDRAQQAAHLARQEPVRPLPRLKGSHVLRGPRALVQRRAGVSGQLLQGADFRGGEGARLLGKAGCRAQQQREHKKKGKKPFAHGRNLLYLSIIWKSSATQGGSLSRNRPGAGSPVPPAPVSACLPALPAPAAPAAPASGQRPPQAHRPRTG